MLYVITHEEGEVEISTCNILITLTYDCLFEVQGTVGLSEFLLSDLCMLLLKYCPFSGESGFLGVCKGFES